MTTANSNEAEHDYPVGHGPEVQAETVELDRRAVERLGALRGDDESYNELITEFMSIFATNELSTACVDGPLIG